MEKRVILATVISTIIIIVWWMFYTPKINRLPAPANISRNQSQQLPKGTEIKPNTQKVNQNTEKTVQVCEDITVESDKWKIVLNPMGACIKNYFIKENLKNNGPVSTDLVLVPESGYFTTFESVNFKLLSRNEQADTITVAFYALVNKTTKCYKTYVFDKEDYLHKVSIVLENSVPEKDTVELSFGPGLGTDKRIQDEENGLTVVSLYEKNANNKYFLKKLKPGKYTAQNSKWVSIHNRYFVMTLVNKGDVFSEVNVAKEEAGAKVKLLRFSVSIPYEGKRSEFEMPFYFGINKFDKLKEYAFDLDKTIDFGFFSFLSKIFFACLKFFYGIAHNYGVAIIFLTIILQIITIPLTIKSFKTTKAMKAIQPRMKELQEKFKSDPKRLNAEMMYLYKSQKVNPFGGCLPIIIQLPIFWSLFNVLKNTYELRGATFTLWIKDLSAPDLLFSLGGVPVRVLPLLMGLSMYVQQKLTSVDGLDQSQKMFTYLMPVMFTVIFINFPSGLVLYWLVNNILMIAVQFYLLRG